MAIYKFDPSAGREFDKEKYDLESFLKSEIIKYKLSENAELALDGNIVTLTGTLPDQSILERLVLVLGNVKGVAQVNTDKLRLEKNVVPTKVTRFYEVCSGDSLWKIAEAVYGPTHGDKYKIIFEANKPLVSQPDDIFSGQILRVPNIDAV